MSLRQTNNCMNSKSLSNFGFQKQLKENKNFATCREKAALHELCLHAFGTSARWYRKGILLLQNGSILNPFHTNRNQYMKCGWDLLGWSIFGLVYLSAVKSEIGSCVPEQFTHLPWDTHCFYRNNLTSFLRSRPFITCEVMLGMEII